MATADAKKWEKEASKVEIFFGRLKISPSSKNHYSKFTSAVIMKGDFIVATI